MTSPKDSLGSQLPAWSHCTPPGLEHVPQPLRQYQTPPRGPCCPKTSVQHGSTEHPFVTQRHPNVLAHAVGNSTEECFLGNITACSATVWGQEVGFPIPPGLGTRNGAVFLPHSCFPRQETSSAASSCCKSFAQHVQEEFPTPGPRHSAREPFRDSSSSERQSLQLEITPCSSASTPLHLSRHHVPFGSSFHHPDVSPFSFLWNFFCFSPCCVQGLKDLAPLRQQGHGTGTAWPQGSIPSLVLSVVLGSRALGRCVQGSQDSTKHSPQHQPSAFQREEQTCWRCLHARTVLIPHGVWQEASSPLKLI